MEALLPIIIILLFLGMALAISFASKKAEKKRREELARAASDMGLEYFEEGDPGLTQFAGAKLFNRGRARRIRNVIQGQTDDVSIRLFDYFFTTGSGKNRRNHRQTVACLQSPDLELTSFSMRPQTAMDTIGKTLGGQDIDFDDHPAFSKMFVLQGDNEAAIRSQFSLPVLDFFAQQQRVWVEGTPDGLLFYRRNKRVPPSGMRELLGDAYKVFAVLRDAGGQYGSGVGPDIP